MKDLHRKDWFTNFTLSKKKQTKNLSDIFLGCQVF